MVPIDEPINAAQFHKKEYEELSKLVKSREPFIVVVGSRGTGKTSLVKILLKDYFGIFVNLSQYQNKKNMRRSYFIDQIYSELAKIARESPGLEKFLPINNSDSILKKEKLEISELFRRLDEWAMKQNEHCLLAIDDTEMLSRFQHLNFENLFAYIIDNCRHISIILLSNDEDAVRKVCHLDELDAPLFGRVYHVIKLGEIPIETISKSVKNFLMSHNHYLTPTEEHHISDLSQRLSHSFRSAALMINELIKTTIIDNSTINTLLEKYSEIQHKQFEDFISNRPAKEKYEKIMQFLAKQDASWTMIKDFLELDLGEKLYDKNFTELLDHLEKSEYIEKASGLYRLKNPLLRYFYNKKNTFSDMSTDSYLSHP